MEVASPVSKARRTSAAAAGKSRIGNSGESGKVHKRGERAQAAAAKQEMLLNTTAELLAHREVVEGLTKTLQDETAKSSELASKLRLAEDALQVNVQSGTKALENQLQNVTADLLESRAVIEHLTMALDVARAQLTSSQAPVEQCPVCKRSRLSSSSQAKQTRALHAEAGSCVPDTLTTVPAVEELQQKSPQSEQAAGEIQALALASQAEPPLPVESPVPDLQLHLASVEDALKAERSRSAGLAAQLQHAEEAQRILQIRVDLVQDCNDWRRSCREGDTMYKPFYERVALGEALAYICSGQPPLAAWGPAAAVCGRWLPGVPWQQLGQSH